jgi:hypothetical protein
MVLGNLFARFNQRPANIQKKGKSVNNVSRVMNPRFSGRDVEAKSCRRLFGEVIPREALDQP